MITPCAMRNRSRWSAIRATLHMVFTSLHAAVTCLSGTVSPLRIASRRPARPPAALANVASATMLFPVDRVLCAICVCLSFCRAGFWVALAAPANCRSHRLAHHERFSPHLRLARAFRFLSADPARSPSAVLSLLPGSLGHLGALPRHGSLTVLGPLPVPG